jgi:uncharacterized RDD family membrane protein YckC
MSTNDPRAGRGRRLCAFAVDFVVTAVVAFIAIWPLGLFENEQAYEPSQLVIRIVLLIAGSYLLVNGWLLYRRGQTVGKRLLRIRMIAHADGRPLPFWRLLARTYSVMALAAIPLIGVLVIVDILFIFTRQRRCLHDILVGSTVTRITDGEPQSR